MAKRSPILGYNHNIRYRGVVFHVQTEDSGVENPHVFTHLFQEGVILSTRKLDYDAEAAEEVVRSLMQAQHKAVLRDLKHGRFSDRIEEFLCHHPDLRPPSNEDLGSAATHDLVFPPADPAAEVATAPLATSNTEISGAFEAIWEGVEPLDNAVLAAPGAGGVPPASGAHAPPRGPPRAAAATPGERAVPGAPLAGRETTRPYPAGRPGGDGVIVSRPAVIVGAPPSIAVGSPSARHGSSPGAPVVDLGAGLFDQELISEKSLDEVILAYLSEDSSEE